MYENHKSQLQRSFFIFLMSFPQFPYMSYLIIYLFYFICHTIITKNIGKEKKKKWRGDLTETIEAYERLGLLELWARAVSHQLKKRRQKVEDGKIYELFSYLLNNLIFSFFLREERDWELMILLTSELKNLGPWKRARTSSCLYDKTEKFSPFFQGPKLFNSQFHAHCQ